ncbi:MAG: RagB/SusD family nutrient uptake outer membrane protein [Prevotella sp.]|nr:RagB/SusD family nutrient uptake outer membrane protein [Prevotella sp.]
MKYFNHIALTFILLLGLASCTDSYLDKQPDERVEIDTEDKVVMLLTSAYPSGNWGEIAELSSDNMIDNNAPHYPHNPDAKQVLVHYNLSSAERIDDEIFRFDPGKSSTSTDSPTLIWEGCYNGIATANLALESIDKLVDEAGGVMSAKLKAARAEALLIRAYCHFILVNMFSQAYKNDEASAEDIGVPYITKSEDTVMPSYDRGTVTDDYNNIEADLEAGLADITDDNYTLPKWHFNVNAAHAFAARFYLYKRDYDKVIEHANAVLGEGTSLLSSKLMDYSGFDDCTNSSDYATAWQSASINNNLLLIPTYSIQWRKSAGYRYSCAGDALVGTIYHTTANSNWYAFPTAYVAGFTFYVSDTDYGFTCAKICETFEYTDKVSGVGYAHLVRREFTATELLLDRAEAKLLSKTHQDIDGAIEDLIAYDDSRCSFSDANTAIYTANSALVPLTKDRIDSYYSKSTNTNCYANWDFTQNMSSDFVVPENAVTYMNCLNDFRRFETWQEGWRFFDLKRFGIEYSHFVGLENTEYRLTWDDPRRAIEIPQEVIAAGLQSSRPLTEDNMILSNEARCYDN